MAPRLDSGQQLGTRRELRNATKVFDVRRDGVGKRAELECRNGELSVVQCERQRGALRTAASDWQLRSPHHAARRAARGTLRTSGRSPRSVNGITVAPSPVTQSALSVRAGSNGHGSVPGTGRGPQGPDRHGHGPCLAPDVSARDSGTQRRRRYPLPRHGRDDDPGAVRQARRRAIPRRASSPRPSSGSTALRRRTRRRPPSGRPPTRLPRDRTRARRPAIRRAARHRR